MKHGRMRYWSLPEGLLADHLALMARATAALDIARASNKLGGVRAFRPVP